ncbi:glycerol-3-phosphate acyltransferase [bacterium]|jgi:glycerol-3-phosphate acyltransferase PlsY|nr:glycerol-3-phosphate acyltransferase [bacterium]
MNEGIAYLESHPILTILICAITGYLMGSISFARIVFRGVTKEKEPEAYSEPIAGTDEKFDTDFVSASLVNKRIGARYGCLTSVADMLKVILPTLGTKLLLTSEPYFLIVTIFAMIGHYLPVYHHFKGGRGETIMLGSMIVFNWVGTIIVFCISTVLGFVTGSVVVLRYAIYFLMVFWLWHHYHDWRYALGMFILIGLFIFSMRKELALIAELRKRGLMNDTNEELSEKMFMGRHLGRAVDRYSIPALLKKLRSDKTEKQGK